MKNVEVVENSSGTNPKNNVFTLIGNHGLAKLALNGEVVRVNQLQKKGYRIEKSPEKDGEHCAICAPEGGDIRRTWYNVFLSCNDVSGYVWICSNCSKVYIHKRGGKALWAELEKTF